MTTITPKIRFEKSGYYFIALLMLVFLGFWQSYFSKFFGGKSDYSFYFHFHAVMMLLWVFILIAQPLLIRRKKLHWHRLIGKATYVIMPLMLISVLLLLHSRLKGVAQNELSINMILFPIRDIILLACAFSIGVWYRRKIQVHARAMIITGIVFIEPALFRFLNRVLFKGMPVTGFYVGITLILGLLAALIIIERKQKSGRWLFPAFLVIDIIVYCIVIFEIPLVFLDPLVRWFARLPLT